ncbi:beta-1,3-glucuronyltransferase, putative [Ricinus communis]|uniref:Glycosyltransferases n=1 Tax=Ricinus communis TaxID=3988 RepID=B9SGQ5_RICCO|nr:beta-1,3-glucuronyltransferase, putative [Ricinus communis]|eukprot:XP_002525174.1 probable beta-1,4-xylosyltransferase IRX9 [Ricinus communis]
MGSVERSKKKVQLWKKAVVHFSLCFVMGFFTGFAPTAKSSIFSSHISLSNKPQFSPQPTEMPHPAVTPLPGSNVNKATVVSDQTPVPVQRENQEEEVEREEEEEEEEPKLAPRKLIIIITPTSTLVRYQKVFLRRLANTIKLVPPPLLWIVVEGQTDSNEVSEMLRKTGIMYRHLVSKENFTDIRAELDHQRNVALRHLEQHRLSGIVHFASLSNVYDLAFFDELRDIEGFGTWPMALLSPNKNKVIIEGPICDSSQVIGWHLKKMNNNNQTDARPPIHISSFAFNSSILWDPERWGRPSSVPHTSQNSIKFVKQVALEDETKLKGIPPEECSKIMLWQLKFPIEKESYDPLSNVASDGNSDEGDKSRR